MEEKILERRNREMEEIKKEFRLISTEQDKHLFYFIIGMALAAIVYCIAFSIFFLYIRTI